jgi:hypothetical protein
VKEKIKALCAKKLSQSDYFANHQKNNNGWSDLNNNNNENYNNVQSPDRQNNKANNN